MPADDDIGLDEKRVYADTRTETRVYVASATGLARVQIAGDRIGRFSLALREPVRDAAGRHGRLLVATDGDVLVGTGEGFERTGFGPARAVGIDGDRPLAADGEGVSALAGDSWQRIGAVAGVRAIDGDLVAAADGTYRIADGLARVHDAPALDVAAAGPYAACEDGLYDLDGGLLREGRHDAVAADGGRAEAVADGGLLERRGEAWVPVALPTDEPVVDAAHGEATYAVTAAGTVLVGTDPDRTPDGRGGWRARALGLDDPRRLTVP